ncbi:MULTISPECIES: hypothetical protein [Methylomonas]|uniref:Uncharacterized protein n=1 Tax=Methylomonas koyamae TaxID=702114 RepID=A0A177NWE3_9GAMM|nr:hypothetical protein [Methylomonas koyamae]OAI21400.1 hypothetical protein A1355_02675 [Methylomonas koyamae]
MNTLIYYSFNLLILTLVLLLVGLIKPKWLLFWMDKPGRLPIIFVCTGLFMTSAVMYGEGNKELQAEKAQQAKAQTPPPPAPTSGDVPVVKPVPAAKPATQP